jgi:hypothetical protein
MPMLFAAPMVLLERRLALVAHKLVLIVALTCAPWRRILSEAGRADPPRWRSLLSQFAVLVVVLSGWVLTGILQKAEDLNLLLPLGLAADRHRRNDLLLIVTRKGFFYNSGGDFCVNDALLLLALFYYHILLMFVVLFFAAAVASLICGCI